MLVSSVGVPGRTATVQPYQGMQAGVQVRAMPTVANTSPTRQVTWTAQGTRAVAPVAPAGVATTQARVLPTAYVPTSAPTMYQATSPARTELVTAPATRMLSPGGPLEEVPQGVASVSTKLRSSLAAWSSAREKFDNEDIDVVIAKSSLEAAENPGLSSAREATFSIPQPLSEARASRPHDFFPFDFLSWKVLVENDGYGLDKFVMEELSYVRTHCMIPPFPWGQVIYRQLIMDHIIANDIPGDFAEYGIGLGGTSIFFARLAKSWGRKFLSVDSFEGLPPPDLSKENVYFLQGDYKPNPGQDNYEKWLKYKSKFDVDDMLVTLKGFFRDVTIPPEFSQFAFVHLDSDLYDSVYDSLEAIWDRVVEGGIVAIDDFFHHAQGPARAVSDFFRTRCAEPPLIYVVPTYAVLVIKGRSACLQQSKSGKGIMHSPRALDGNFYSFKLLRECAPLVRAAQLAVERARQAYRIVNDEQKDAMSRCLKNAEDFYSFVKYSDTGPRSGTDIFRYLTPLEDQWDIYQGNLCGMPGEERKIIQINLTT